MKPQVFAATCALTCACAAIAPASAQETGPVDTVRLRFAWPAGTVARVQTTRFRETINETADTMVVSADYRLQADSHPEGLLVSYDDFRFPSAVGDSAASAMETVAQRAAAMVPKLIVAPDGSFLRIHDVASIRAGLDSMFVELMGEDGMAAMREMLNTVMSEDALTVMAAEEWNAIVGMWIDADLELGAVYQYEDQAPLPVLPDVVVPMLAEFMVEDRTSCVEGGSDTDCVTLHFVSWPDPDSVNVAIRRFFETLPAIPGADNISFEELDVENEMIIVTEPGTLRPHRVQISKLVSGVVKAGDERGEVSQFDVRTYHYTYAR